MLLGGRVQQLTTGLVSKDERSSLLWPTANISHDRSIYLSDGDSPCIFGQVCIFLKVRNLVAMDPRPLACY